MTASMMRILMMSMSIVMRHPTMITTADPSSGTVLIYTLKCCLRRIGEAIHVYVLLWHLYCSILSLELFLLEHESIRLKNLINPLFNYSHVCHHVDLGYSLNPQ